MKLQKCRYLVLAVFVIAALTQQMVTPVTTYAAPAAADPVPANWCPTSEGEAATVLSADLGTWKLLPRDGRDHDAYKFKSDTLVKLSIPRTTDNTPVGDFDHWKPEYGNGYQGDMEKVDSATYNCPKGSFATAAPQQSTSQTNTGPRVDPPPSATLPTGCPRDNVPGQESWRLTDATSGWTYQGNPKWRGHSVFTWHTPDATEHLVYFPPALVGTDAYFDSYTNPGQKLQENTYTQSLTLHCPSGT